MLYGHHRPAAFAGVGAGLLTFHRRVDVVDHVAEAAGLVVVGVGIDDGDLVEAALARLAGGVGQMPRGVEFLDGERLQAAA